MRGWFPGLLAVAVLVPLAGSPLAQARPTRSAADSVSLLTGDQVYVNAAGTPRYLQPGKGRERQTFTVYQSKGHNFVVPSDAAPLVAKGVLDERLFDITELRDSGYHRATPLIVQYAGSQRTLAPANLASINAASVTAQGSGFWNSLTAKRSEVAKVWLDRKRQVTLDRSVPQIGAPAAWQAGYTGNGVTVAVLDTGVDQTHPDLASREIGERNFSGSRDSIDHYGHGTHVASIVAGTGAKSGGKFRGVAPDARLLDVKVLQDNGNGNDSNIIAGMQWAAKQGADIITMSLGGFDDPGVDPVEDAVNRLSAQYGTLFVIAAGNFGPDASTVSSPGSADAALTVGAVDRANRIADFSGRGPREGGGVIKPDLTGPGVGIVAALHAEGRIGEPVVDGYTALSGTSMATPHVAGAAALLAQQHPKFAGEQLKSYLIAASTPTPGLTPFQQGAGRVDSAKALNQTVGARPSSVSFGDHRWPHAGRPPITTDVTYTNDGTTPVTLDLRMETTGPAGLFTVSPSQLVIPAGGSAVATAKADIANAPAGGQFGGALVASSGGLTVRTAVEVDLEIESYDLTLDATGRSGLPADFVSAFLINVDTGDRVFPDASMDGRIVHRIPAGRYVLSASILGDYPATHDVLNYPDLRITGPTTIDLDARLGRPIKLKLPDDTAKLTMLQVGFERVVGPNRYLVSNLSAGGGFDHIGLAQLGPDAPAGEVTGQLSTNWTAQSGFYGLAWYIKDRAPAGFDKVIRASDLAKVTVDIGPLRPGQSALIGSTSSPHDRGDWGLGSLMPVAVPGVYTEYYGGENADWARRMTISESTGHQGGLNGPPKSYTPGNTYTESFYRGVFGPVFSDNRGEPWVQQRGDTMIANIPLFGDGAGNAGFSAADSASTKLYRNDELLSETNETGFGRFAIPQGTARYRLTAEANRSGYDRATSVSASWTFQSDHSSGITPLPVSVIRYTPKLNANEKAPAGALFAVPIHVQPQPGASVKAKPCLTSTEVSYDGGTTWQNAALFGDYLVLYHPVGATSVSLRAKAADNYGNSVEQTIINAYLLD